MRALPLLVLPVLLLSGPIVVRAQAPTLAQRQSRLSAARAAAAAAQARADTLDRGAAAERDEALKARGEEAAAALRVRSAEANIAAAQARVEIIERQLQDRRARLARRRAAIGQLVAAMQSMARRPTLLALVQPGTTADLVHVRAVLAAAVPAIRERTAGLRAELADIGRLRAQGAAALEALRAGRAKLEAQRLALVRLEAAHRLRARDYGRSALVESDRAIALGEQARDLVDQMRVERAAAETVAGLATLAGPLPRPGESAARAPVAPPPYRLPVAGRLVTGLGELSDSGVRARGLTLVTQPRAPVVAPAAGRVLFARRFRDYGNIVILDHGRGWTTLLTGLGTLAVERGATVRPGAPIGRAPPGEAPRVTVELRRRGQPVDIAALIG